MRHTGEREFVNKKRQVVYSFPNQTGKLYQCKVENTFQSDKEHFEYWSSHLLPPVGLVHKFQKTIQIQVD